MATSDSATSRGAGEPVKLPPRKRRPLLEFALPATSVGSGIMLALAVPSILDASSVWDYMKAGTLAFSATAVSYGVNKLAVERGTELGTTGYHGATVVSIGSILAVGGGLFAATYSGLSLKDTGKLQLQEHGQALSAYVGTRSSAASSAARINPAIRATEADLRDKAACEIATSCISGHRSGGHGPVSRIVQGHAGRAASIAQQITAGEAAREQIVRQLNIDIAAYQTILADESLAFAERRAKLQTVDARIRQGVGALDAVVPLGLVAAYANELQSGVSIPGRPEANGRLNAILSSHGKSLAAVVEGVEDVKMAPPSFPGRPGVADTFRYILHFLPIAAIAAVVELIFPLVLWAYTFWALAWRKHKEDPPSGGGDEAPRMPKPSAPPSLHVPPLAAVAQEPARRGRALRLPNGDGRRGEHGAEGWR